MAEKTKKLLRRSRNRPPSEGNAFAEVQQFRWLSFLCWTLFFLLRLTRLIYELELFTTVPPAN